MVDSPHIRLWLGNQIPSHFRQAIRLPEINASQDASGASELQGVIIVFVAHVPFAVLNNPVYMQGNWQEENCGWMREGEIGLFGTNAMKIYPHPDGDGILILGCAV